MNEIMVDTFDGLSEEATICMSVISEMEVLAGCRNRFEQETAKTFMEDFAILPIEADESMRASNLYSRFHLSHGVGILDCLIASTAILRKLDFFSRNQKHFKMFPGIKLRAPY